MPLFMIERDVPEIDSSAQYLEELSKASCGVLESLDYDATEISWIQSFVTENKLLCLYQASALEMIQEYARKGGFPINQVLEICSVIDPEIISSGANYGPSSVTPDVPDDAINPVPRYMVERSWPGAGSMSRRELQVVAERIEAQIERMRNSSSAPLSWIRTYITPNKLFEVFTAPNMASARDISAHGLKDPQCILRIRFVNGP
mmetsp:Transcript_92201/g.183651  ORF Transcript_92201/g.183651 Transcript_92201/m.183651 type:complete len:204 (-) Transcript_92201:74-685(-)|eukprot:CAMPEP_0171780196 /NCGR_PEP_ID=MMETSP0991-20121206/59468_1 /TAXON_ID=483369 /ORGANISM="non described non described, Strain CCMP2098" /LENGTH=203 /DNA_ID=CAMNT_0012387525 /DNA_START=450 /DNA_END=1061 /DNA_ORIENTATION=+